MIETLIRKMARRDQLAEPERTYLEAVFEPARRVGRGGAVLEPGDHASRSTLLISGLCARFTTLSDGGRQFTQIHLPGDFVDLHSLLMKQMDHGVMALTDCVITSAPHAKLKRMTEEQPHLTRMLWLETVVDGAIHRQWLVTLGRQDALSRLAHLLCELGLRSEGAGLSGREAFDLPLSQAELSDFLGVTPVHFNRTLMSLRALGLADWRGGRVEIRDWAGLVELGEFDPTYLRLQNEPV